LEVSHSDGAGRWVRIICNRDKGSILGVVTDITADVMEKKKIEYERDYDVLTNLLNRRAFEEKLRQLKERTRNLKIASMLVWDLDNLKYVNDTYGHSTGDAYLVAFANCLKKFDKDNVVSARRSGDEFVTFIYGYDRAEQIEELIEEIWSLVQKTYIVLHDQRRYRIRISIGRAWYPKDSIDFDTLFQYADFAMYIVKHSRKGTMEDFDQAVYQENRIILQGQEAFHNLLEQKMVDYMLQPIVWAKDGSIYGYEMLMRSKLEIFKSPMDILRIAQSQSKLYDIEVLTLFEAMGTFVSKVKEGACDKDSKVFINSIANQIMSKESIELFCNTYSEYLSNFVCEMTEKEEEDESMTNDKLKLIKSWGGLVALDDYGYGYNSESTLLRISPNIVKIDMSIVRGIDKDDKRRRLVANLVLYTRERDILLLAEGIETREELKTIVSLGVQLLQGYYIAKPSYEANPPTQEVKDELLYGIYSE
ncbi:MAG TPA: diguanylate phosphodiesterase, partial [Clostridiales bacterium]|nr:diguanylate phosphodiesterase [Clostridiales bacterium]